MAVLADFANVGTFNAAVQEWEQKPIVERMWDNIKTFISEEFTKANKKGLMAHQAGFGSANAVQMAITDISQDQANLTTNVVKPSRK